MKYYKDFRTKIFFKCDEKVLKEIYLLRSKIFSIWCEIKNLELQYEVPMPLEEDFLKPGKTKLTPKGKKEFSSAMAEWRMNRKIGNENYQQDMSDLCRMKKERYLGPESRLKLIFGRFSDAAKEYINNKLDADGRCTLYEVKYYIYTQYVIPMKEMGLEVKDEEKINPAEEYDSLYGWLD